MRPADFVCGVFGEAVRCDKLWLRDRVLRGTHCGEDWTYGRRMRDDGKLVDAVCIGVCYIAFTFYQQGDRDTTAYGITTLSG